LWDKSQEERERERKERGRKEKVNILQLPQKKNFYKGEECKPHLWNDDVSESKKKEVVIKGYITVAS